MDFVCFNGKFLPADEPLFTAHNRSFRYGDGLFETIKVCKGKILLEQFHYDRLFLGLKMLQIDHALNAAGLSQNILELCRRNNCVDVGRVRLAVFRNGENHSEYVMEGFPVSSSINEWNKKGLSVEVFPYARKSPDAFSNFKTASFLPYVLAEVFAKERGFDDAIVLNAFNFLCDSSKANIFLIKDQQIYTPALNQGCVSGVMRRFLLDELKKSDFRVHQEELSEQQLLNADEVFFTNSIYDIRWVEQFRDKKYSCKQTHSIYQKITAPLY